MLHILERCALHRTRAVDDEAEVEGRASTLRDHAGQAINARAVKLDQELLAGWTIGEGRLAARDDFGLQPTQRTDCGRAVGIARHRLGRHHLGLVYTGRAGDDRPVRIESLRRVHVCMTLSAIRQVHRNPGPKRCNGEGK